ncbi:hypothetical protein ES332_D08G042600v1 [Gossypium tomentosum]|uniref:Uncharacterized protein n=1 Tax=Gossypium tomentosum TaxID=34277 RepID=A0A5D2JPN3_GOSTO|nr:hypothetical protein ES332_D08G042600v1 [Gossypium tomentosum]
MTLSMCFSTTTAADPIPTSDPHPPHSSDSQSLMVVSSYKFADFPGHSSDHANFHFEILFVHIPCSLYLPS